MYVTMQNAQLNKQRWTTGKKINLESEPKPNFCVSLRSARWSEKKTSHWRETTERTDLQRDDRKARLLFFFFLSVLTCFAESALNIKVSIYTSAVNTEQQGQKTVARTKGSKSRNFQKLATTLRQVLLVRNDVKILCCCCSNNTISTAFLPFQKYTRTK